MYVVLLAIMIHLFAKDYYVAPVYPVLFAAGALAWQNLFSALAKNGVAAAGLVHGDGHPWRDHASHGNSSHAAVYLDSLYQSASPDQPEH